MHPPGIIPSPHDFIAPMPSLLQYTNSYAIYTHSLIIVFPAPIYTMRKGHKNALTQSSDSVECIGGSTEQSNYPEFLEVDFAFEQRDIQSLKLTIQAKKEEAGKIYWDIKVEEGRQDTQGKSKKQGKETSYNIRRTFTQFKWLLNELRSKGDVFVLPSLGRGSSSLDVNTYIKTKVVKDEKVLDQRQEHLNRFIRKLCENKKIVESKPFQIFIHKTREEFQAYKKRYQEDTKTPSKGYFTQLKEAVGNLIPAFNSDTEMILVYKEMFADAERDVASFLEALKQIFTSHHEYLVFLREYDQKLTSADQEYNSNLDKLVKWVELIAEQIAENKREVGRERNKQEHDKFKAGFQQEVEEYKKSIRAQLKQIAKSLSEINATSCTKISNLFKQSFTIRV